MERATWKDGALDVTLLEPFEQLRRSNQLSTTKDRENNDSGRQKQIWLPSLDVIGTFATENAVYSNPKKPFISYNIGAKHNQPSKLDTQPAKNSN